MGTAFYLMPVDQLAFDGQQPGDLGKVALPENIRLLYRDLDRK